MKLIWTLEEVVRTIVQLFKLLSHKDVTKICFAPNNPVVKVCTLIWFFLNDHRLIKYLFPVLKVVFLNVNFSMPMLGSACLKTDKGNTTGSNMKMGLNLESKNNALVSIFSYHLMLLSNQNLVKVYPFLKRCLQLTNYGGALLSAYFQADISWKYPKILSTEVDAKHCLVV